MKKAIIMLMLLGVFAYLKATTPAVAMLYYVALLPLETIVFLFLK